MEEEVFPNGPETQTQWKSESVTDLLMDQLTGVGARDVSLVKIWQKLILKGRKHSNSFMCTFQFHFVKI